MFRRLLAILAALSSLTASQPAQASQAREGGQIVVTVTHDTIRNGGRIIFDLPEGPSVWAFPESGVSYAAGEPWRPASWRVLTPGVRLVRVNNIDALVLEATAPRQVEIDYDDYSATLRAAYEPAIAFDGGDVALFTGQYFVSPLTDETALADAGLNLPTTTQRMVFRQPNANFLFSGRTAKDEITLTGADQTYVFMGMTPLLETPEIAAVIDPGLPEWIQQGVKEFTPRLLAYFERRLGQGAEGRPTLYVAWGGAERQGLGMGGGALPGGLITMQIGGTDAVEPSPANIQALAGFIGHEASHFWIGQGIRASNSTVDAWVHEGAADAISFRGVAALNPGLDITFAFQASLDRCVVSLEHGPLSTAISRGDPRANYACGAVFNLAAERALAQTRPDADLMDFWRELLDSSRERGWFSLGAWVHLFKSSGGAPEAADIILRLAAEGSRRPSDDLARLFDLTHVSYRRDEAGKVALGAVPPTKPA